MVHAKVNGSTDFEVALQEGSFLLNGEAREINIVKVDAYTFNVLFEGHSFNVFLLNLNREEKLVELRINGKKAQVHLTTELDLMLKKLGLENAGALKARDLKAPMPGLILSILVKEGQEVKKGDPVLILEAMKMENVLKAAADATIGKVHVESGSSVEKGHLMVSFA